MTPSRARETRIGRAHAPLESTGAGLLRIAVRLAASASTLLYIAVQPAVAHDQSRSQSQWLRQGDRLFATFSTSAWHATAITSNRTADELARAWSRAIDENVSVSVRSDSPCDDVAPAQAVAAAPGFLRVEKAYGCKRARAVMVTLTLHDLFPPNHIHYATGRDGTGSAWDRTLTRRSPTLEIAPDIALGLNSAKSAATAGSEIASEIAPDAASKASDGSNPMRPQEAYTYFRLGVDHILRGHDHIAFLAALVMATATIGRLAWMISGFTLGHALSLGLATTGKITTDSALVEILIAFTVLVASTDVLALATTDRNRRALATLISLGIAYAAYASRACDRLPLQLWIGAALFGACFLLLASDADQADRSQHQAHTPGNANDGIPVIKPALTAGFGVAHGLGFAGVLAELGARHEHVATKLLSFNVGVEVAQLAIAFAIAAAVRTASRFGRARLPARELIATALCAASVYWMTLRILSAC